MRHNPTVATAARRDIAHQQTYDRNYDGRQATLAARMRPSSAHSEPLPTASPTRPTLRQSLVDLAAVSELIADELPAPGPHEAP